MLVGIISFIPVFAALLSVIRLFAWCIMSYFLLKHICIICTNRYQSYLPHGNSTAAASHNLDKDATADILSLNLTRLVELPAPQRRDSGMIRY
ncbi:hypothetical protein BGW37DRAFT_485983 [Umbelopsis sp. PMI_123]|nr:hypothetical protein BGW37DRAFT_485983 [Umbelopsis sp. PMI_123]